MIAKKPQDSMPTELSTFTYRFIPNGIYVRMEQL